MIPRSYEGVAVCCPVTEPYVRRSEHRAVWFLARALRRLVDASGLAKSPVQGSDPPQHRAASINVTSAPARAKWNAALAPSTPAPTTPTRMILAPPQAGVTTADLERNKQTVMAFYDLMSGVSYGRRPVRRELARCSDR
jgi:hypothetical protein